MKAVARGKTTPSELKNGELLRGEGGETPLSDSKNEGLLSVSSADPRKKL